MEEVLSKSPTGYPVFYRTYSRKIDGNRESWKDMCDRTVDGLARLGKFTDEERELVYSQQMSMKAMASGRWLWVGGTPWIEKPENYNGAFNCTGTNVIDWKSFGLMMDLAMQGSGTGAVLEPKYIDQLPVILNHLEVEVIGNCGDDLFSLDKTKTKIEHANPITATIKVGDSRQGWVQAYQNLLELSSVEGFNGYVKVVVDVSSVRKAGKPLKGFGGTANPIKLPELFPRCAKILNKAVGRKLSSVECCLLIDEAASCVVAGNIRRSAGIRQFSSEDTAAAIAKDNLWIQAEDGSWKIDPERDALRMANHTRVFHKKPSLDECVQSVRKQFHSGEGAIQWAGEAVARSNADIVTPERKKAFIEAYEKGLGREWLQYFNLSDEEIEHRLQRYGLNPCFRGDMRLLTSEGYKRFDELDGTEPLIVNASGNVTQSKVWCSGEKDIVELKLTNRQSIFCTPDHRFRVLGDPDGLEAKDCKGHQLTPFLQQPIHPLQFVALGFIQGDGQLSSLHKQQGVEVNIGQKDYEILQIFDQLNLEYKWYGNRKIYLHGLTDTMKASGFSFAPLPVRKFPEKYSEWNLEEKAGFLSGLYTANGSALSCGRISFKTSCFDLASNLIEALAEFGIDAYYTVNKPFAVSFSNGVYQCRESYDVNIQQYASRLAFFNAINFAFNYKTQNLANNLISQAPTVRAIKPAGVAKVYDFTEPETHWGVVEGFAAHNCGEIISADFHCVSGDTLLITKDGMKSIRSLVGESVEIWNGAQWSAVIPFQTGSNRTLYRVKFNDGTFIDATEQHRWFVRSRHEAKYSEVTTLDLIGLQSKIVHTEPFEIQYDDGIKVAESWAYTLGFATGDGTTTGDLSYINLYGDKKTALKLEGTKYTPNPHDTFVGTIARVKDLDFSGDLLRRLKQNPDALEMIASWNKQSILSFVAGLADADGSNTTGGGIRIYISQYERAYRIHLLLIKCGIRSSINLMSSKGERTNLGVRSQDVWYLQITDCKNIPCQRLDVSRGHKLSCKGKWQVIRSVEALPGTHDTFCFNEPVFHKGVFGSTLAGNCNLSEVHLNRLDPLDFEQQKAVFKSAALCVAALLQRGFVQERYQKARDLDPIVGVSITGLFDFFVQTFGVDWLRWWEAGRPTIWSSETYDRTAKMPQSEKFIRQEREYLQLWNHIVHETVWEYCDRHGLKRPNRCTTTQPAGSKSLLTGASSGWHPPKAQRYIRRITFGKNDPVALACIDYGYNVVPSQSDKDEDGNLLNDPFDPRCTEWLVEIPVEVPWANLPGADEIAIEKFSALAQFSFYMQVQKHYALHNVSATLELHEDEIEPLGTRIYEAIQNDEGYISAALLARYDAPFPRLPFEKIDRETYERLQAEVLARRQTDDFHTALARYETPAPALTPEGPAGCDSDKCLFPVQQPKQ